MKKNNQPVSDPDHRELWYQRIRDKVISPGALVAIASAVVLASFGESIVKLFNSQENAYNTAVVYIGVAYLLFIGIAIVLWAIIFSKDRNKEIVEVIQDQPEPCRNVQNELLSIQAAATHLQGIISEPILKDMIISRSAIDNLEGSVSEKHKIYIMTSSFLLENTDFREIIIRNFRKGVFYIYYIPSTKGLQDNFFSRADEWFHAYTIFLNDKEAADRLLDLYESDKKHGHSWTPDYLSLVRTAIVYHEKKNESKKREGLSTVRKQAIEMFKKLLVTYEFEENLFFITAAMYEIEIGRWKAIMKIPTVDKAENFTALSVSGKNNLETTSKFIGCITGLSHNKERLSLKDSVFD